MGKKKKESKRKGKKAPAERPKSKKWELYEVGETLKRKNRFCPKCGPGVFMAHHKDRWVCGKCGYTEFI